MDVSLRGGTAGLGGQKDHDQVAALAGISVLWRSESLLLGGSFDVSSRAGSLSIGDVRHLFFAAVAGASVRLTDSPDLQLLGEAGGHRVSGTRLGPLPVAPDPTAGVYDLYWGTDPDWAPFVGLRPGIEVRAGAWAIGLAGWARVDLIPLDPDPYLGISYLPADGVYVPTGELNRLSFGADLHVGYRFY